MSALREAEAFLPLRLSARFESGLSESLRRTMGAHYTSEVLVLRVLRPLFLDRLYAELVEARSVPALRALLDRLRSLRCLDPACGAGNFLVVAYARLRELELVALLRLRALGEVQNPQVCASQFYGIELSERALSVCRDAFAVAYEEHNQLAVEMLGPKEGLLAPRGSPELLADNALRVDWAKLLPAERCSCVFGNPPFVGASRMTAEQREDRNVVFAGADIHKLRTGRLDYVASWYAKAMLYAGKHPIRMAFVSTNSLTQGEQARSMGPLFARLGFHLDFAHRTFHWSSSAEEEAHVHVVVLGFSRMENGSRVIYDYPNPRGEPVAIPARHINVWLADAPDFVLEARREPLLAGYPIGTKGSQPTDGNHLLVAKEDLPRVLADPIASKFLRRYVQARDFLHGEKRYCLWLVDASPEALRRSPLLRERLRAVEKVRLASKTPSVRRRASAPALFTQIRQPSSRYLAMPEVSSESRLFIPAAFLAADVIAGNKLIVFPGADLWLFGMLQSSMFMAWVRALAGRMKSDISISVDLTYCTFPFPETEDRSCVRARAEQVLHARAQFPGSTLGTLYDRETMPKELFAAHERLDEAVELLFGAPKRLRTDADRLDILWARHELLRKEKPRPGIVRAGAIRKSGRYA